MQFWSPNLTLKSSEKWGDAMFAIRLARKLRPNVVLTDLLLPDMDGVGVTESIRSQVPDAQVVILYKRERG